MKTRLGKSALKFTTPLVIAGALFLAGCGGSDAPQAPPPEPMATEYEMALEEIQGAETAAAAQMAYDDVDLTAVTGDEARKLMVALQKRQADLATADRIAEQKKALEDAVAAVDTSDLSTREAIEDANAAINVLKIALGAATDLSDADKMAAQSTITAAESAVSTAVAALDLDDRKMAQSKDLSNKAMDLQAALAGFSGIPTESEIAAAKAALNALNTAIEEAVDLDDAAKNAARLAVANAQGQIERADEARKAEDARKAAADKAAADKAAADKAAADKAAADKAAADKAAADAAMAVTASKLDAGISLPMGDVTSPAATDRAAAYGTGSDASNILVSAGLPADTPVAIPLSEDEEAMIADNHEWEGMRFMAEPDGDTGTYQAVVYSNVGEPTMGKKFGGAAANDEFEYALTDGALTSSQLTTGASRVVLNGVTRTAGTETFNLPDPNPNNEQLINVPGSFHGVSGTYVCDTGAGRTDACTAMVAAEGFTLAGSWTFKPTDPNTRVADTPDGNYASYGWWLHKSEDDATYRASAFHDYKGTEEGTVNLPEAGTATYVGGAAGKYALSSSTGGTNDAGHFTAKATLEADFGASDANTISGTIDDFVGADGEDREWSVELKEASITDAGVISRTDQNDTVWTIDGTAADASGEWSGSFHEQGDDGVPDVATGTFFSTYGDDGKMVGAFGANED